MPDHSVVLFPGMIQPLRLARVYGYLIHRADGLYHPGGSQPICTMAIWRGRWSEAAGSNSTASAMSQQSDGCEPRNDRGGSQRAAYTKETAPGQGGRPRAEAAPGYRTDSLMRLKRM